MTKVKSDSILNLVQAFAFNSCLWARQHEYLGNNWDAADAVPLHKTGLCLDIQGATSAPKASGEKGFTQQAPPPNTELIDNDLDGGRKRRRRCTQCMVEKNGLIRENKTAIKNATNILSSAATKVSKSVSTNYIETVSLVTPKPKTSKNRKIGSNAAFTNSAEQPSSPYPTFSKPKKIKCSAFVVSLNPTDNNSTHSQGKATHYRFR